MKLISVEKSTRPEKKLMAVFEQDNGRTKTTHFGDSSMSDYTKNKDPERRARYLERHGRGRENWNDPTSAGSLSKHLLWGSTTVLASNIRAFKAKFSV
jgi:hypothetical protein